jgi:hypothetical protein
VKPDIVALFNSKLYIYRGDVELEHLSDSWIVYKEKLKLASLSDIKNHFAERNSREIYPNIFILLAIYYTAPVSSAECERSFSALNRLKS